MLGIGGTLLQKVDRDTQKFAFKCPYAEVNGEGVDVQKHPVELGSDGVLRTSFKKSKAGRLKLISTGDGYKTVKEEEAQEYEDCLEAVFEDGRLLREESFEAVRERIVVCSEEKVCVK